MPFKVVVLAASAATKFASACIAQLIQVELLRNRFIDLNLGRLLAKLLNFEVASV